MMAIGQTTLFSMPILQSVYEGSAKEVVLYISTISIVFRIFVLQNRVPVVGFSAPISVTLSIACMEYQKEEVMASRACVISTLLTLLTFPMSFVIVHFALRFL